MIIPMNATKLNKFYQIDFLPEHGLYFDFKTKQKCVIDGNSISIGNHRITIEQDTLDSMELYYFYTFKDFPQ